MNITNTYAIFSAALSTLSDEENTTRHSKLIGALQDVDLSYQEAQGCYLGATEASVVVSLDGGDGGEDFEVVKSIAFNTFDQQAILYVDANNQAVLHFFDGKTEELGAFSEISEKDATSAAGYTILNGKFYRAG